MKTAILTIFTALVLSSGIAKPIVAKTTNNTNVTVLANTGAINKIEVHGNVQLYVSDGAADRVKVYNKYYSESALVQSTNGVLRISSYKAEKLVVWVTANDLRSISAYDNAEVKSFGDLSTIEFNVDLHNNATAKLSMNAFTTNITVSDQAKANVSGNADECELKYTHAENVDHSGLKTVHATKTITPVAEVKKDEFDELANL